jgi:tetratricopeptide (TPR) repeat protein
MSALSPDDPAPQPSKDTPYLEEIRACVAQAWQAGQTPRLEDHLGGLAGAARLRLLRELLTLEVQHRLARGETPAHADYRARFPELAETVLESLLAAPRDDYPPRPLALTEPGPPPGAPRAALPADAVGGPRYRALRLHARGGLGEVHLAEDTELGRAVALKRIQSRHQGNPEGRRRFLREAQVTSRLEHPGVVPVYGLIDDGGEPCYAMRFIEGQSLKEAIAQFHEAEGEPGQRRLALRALLGSFTAVCNTMAYAHSKGVIHRDLKPANVMLGPYGETLVVDWGLARIDEATPDDAAPHGAPDCESGETREGDVMGTPGYMSPEQAAGRLADVGPASDIYCLGATLYQLLTGRAPLHGTDRHDCLERARRGEFLPPRRLKRDVPPGLEAICLKAMAFQPAQRYASAADLAREVDRWLADEPVSAYREPALVRLRRWARRRRTLVTSGVVALVAALLVGGTIWWRWEQARATARERTTRRVSEGVEAAQDKRGQARTAAGREQLELLRGALAEAKQAQQAMQAGEVEAGLQQRVNRLLADLSKAEQQASAAVEQKEKDTDTVARLNKAIPLIVSSGMGGPIFATESADLEVSVERRNARLADEQAVFERSEVLLADALDLLRTAFADQRILVEKLPVEEAARRIRAQSIQAELVEALDVWAAYENDAGKRRHLLDVAQAADQNRWTRQVRPRLYKGNTATLVRLAAAGDATTQRPTMTAILGTELRRQGQTEPALRLMQVAQQQHPRDFWLNYELGLLLMTSDPARSAQFFRAALAVHDQSVPLYTNLGQALTAMGDFEGAEQAQRKAVQLKPKDATGHCNRGLTFVVMQDLKSAADSFRTALKLQPRYLKAQANLASALASTGDLKGARWAFRKALEIDPDHANSHYNLAWLLGRQGKLAEAMKHLEKVVWLNPKDAGAYILLSAYQFRAKNGKAAVRTLRDAAHQIEGNHAILHALGRVLYLTGDPDGAIKALKQSLELRKDALAYHTLTLAHTARRELWEAADALRKSDKLLNEPFRPACGAVLAAGYPAKGEHGLSERERARLRAQALAWLRTNLSAWNGWLAETAHAVRAKEMEPLQRWRTEPALASVRDTAALARLPQAEARQWRQLWDAVEALLTKAALAP